jgi:ubiquinone/menaquinone biosynthesis C-methylase UbiE
MSGAALLSPHQAYQRWARSYDSTPNPLLSLEERCLLPELKKFSGEDVIDLGCGTGRWLRKLEDMSPGSLTGIDMSEAMLAEAEKKVLPYTLLLHADCIATPLPSRFADCVLASFVLSYVRDLEKFAREAARIARFGGEILVSDMHPNAVFYGWRRTFKTSGSSFEIETFPYTLIELVDAMAQAGCRLEEIAEPSFGEEESRIFRQAGRWDEFLKVESLPVIYWARFSVTGK